MNKSNYECYPNPDGTRGWVWNPITGSLSDCPNPNAKRLAHTRLKERYLANRILPALCGCGGYHHDTEIDAHLKDPFYPRFWPERLYQKDFPSLWETKQKPKGIFVCDMSDLFGTGIPEKWTREILDYIRRCPNDRFYLLTKQPQNLPQFSPFPDNCWVGVTATDDALLTQAVVQLGRIKAKVKYLSIEPFLNWNMSTADLQWTLEYYNINWLIIGAQTRPTVYPKIEWVSEIIEAADRAGVAVFLKYNLVGYLPIEEPFYKNDGSGWAIRQELPKG